MMTLDREVHYPKDDDLELISEDELRAIEVVISQMNFRVYFCFILVLGCQGEDITPTPEPPVKAELPDMCRPWRPAPEEFPLPEDEYPVFEGRRDRKICTKRGEAKPGEDPKYENEVTCDLYSSLNLHWFTSA